MAKLLMVLVVAAALVVLSGCGGGTNDARPVHDATQERAGDATRASLAPPSLDDVLEELETERAEREARWDRNYPRAPSRGPVYVDCNRWGVVNEDSDSAYLAADRGHVCR